MFGGSNTESALEKQQNGTAPDANGALNTLDHAGNHVPATSGATLLPRPVASLVSFFAHSTSLSFRIGAFFGGAAIDGVRVTTLTGLELSRAVIEGVLTRAGRDVAIRSSERGKAEAESLLERSLAVLHSTLTSASFFVAATFHLSSTALTSVSHLSQSLLSTLDAILGSSESSRAIAAIVTLIRREFRKSEQGGTDKVGVGDLLVGTVGFAMLQRWGRKTTESEIYNTGGYETVWDVVILDNGIRADVIGTRQLDCANDARDDLENKRKGAASFMSLNNDEEDFGAVERSTSVVDTLDSANLTLSPDDHHQISDEDLRLYIMRQLPRGCHASIKTDTITARTITVDILDDDTAEIAAPPGTKMVAERFHHHQDANDSSSHHLPKHTVVFRTAFNRSQSADVIHQTMKGTKLEPCQSESAERSTKGVTVSTDAPDTVSIPGGRQIVEDLGPELDSQIELECPRPRTPRRVQNDKPLPELRTSNGPSTYSRHAAAPSRSRSCEPSSPSSQSGPDTAKSMFGKGSLAKLAHKVKQTGAEKNESRKRQAPKKPKLDPSTANLSQPKRASTGPLTVRKILPQRPPVGPNTKINPNEGLASPNRLVHAPLPNRDSLRVPLPNSSRVKSVRTPNVHAHQRDARNSGPDYFSVREKNKESFLAQRDSYSRLSADMLPGSSGTARSHIRSSSAMSVTRSETEMTVSISNDHGPSTRQRRSNSISHSIYSLATAGSESSLILAPRPQSIVHDDMETIQDLQRDGSFPGIFPEKHLVQNIRRFCRFSSASYGPSALKVMGVRPTTNTKTFHLKGSDKHEHSAFSNYAGLPPSSILLSSFVDPEGGTNAAGETETGFPLVHYLCLDHESKAVVLALRGTWGFEDILTDMTCDYDDLVWLGRNWKVHKGMHASARRLLQGGGGRVLVTIKAALDEYPDYGVVFCGHSLGGGVAALLATMISVPNDEASGTSFVTASHESVLRPMLPSANGEYRSKATCFLPPGRPIHVYAYGPPAVMSPLLRRATRGLITTVINGQDVVPSLSLGILHDMHAVSVAFKGDASGAKSQIRNRFFDGLRQSIINKFYVDQPPMPLELVMALAKMPGPGRPSRCFERKCARRN
ncbi:hypothetical protein MAP00_006658 [Monascus purpureus]|nr:hypothetical protein MAP00_006658 [Monascus purpureus]